MLPEDAFQFLAGRLNADDNTLHLLVLAQFLWNCRQRTTQVVGDRQYVACEARRSIGARVLNLFFHPATHIRGIGLSRSEAHTSELQSLMRNSYAVFCLKKKQTRRLQQTIHQYL